VVLAQEDGTSQPRPRCLCDQPFSSPLPFPYFLFSLFVIFFLVVVGTGGMIISQLPTSKWGHNCIIPPWYTHLLASYVLPHVRYTRFCTLDCDVIRGWPIPCVSLPLSPHLDVPKVPCRVAGQTIYPTLMLAAYRSSRVLLDRHAVRAPLCFDAATGVSSSQPGPACRKGNPTPASADPSPHSEMDNSRPLLPGKAQAVCHRLSCARRLQGAANRYHPPAILPVFICKG